jgi:UDP-2-acetamido-3-amino-2,3-dideoxy-glucuronate N-acetyltransferase
MIKVGIIGLGYWGNILYRSLRNNKNIIISKVCGRINNNYGEIFTNDYKEVIKSDVDLIIISTQTKYHYEIIKECLNNNKNVFVEKPICLDIPQSEEVIKLSEEKKLLLFVDHIYTTNPYIIKIKEVMGNDHSDLIHYKSFRFNESCNLFDTSIIENLMYHDFYIVDFLLRDFEFNIKNSSITHTPFEYCDLNLGNINLVSSYKDKKTRLLQIKTKENNVLWNELTNLLYINGEKIDVHNEIDNINYKFNDVLNHIKKGKDDGSKNTSLKILKIINNL